MIDEKWGRLPEKRLLYYGGGWHEPKSGRSIETFSPGTGKALGRFADAGSADVDLAVEAALHGFREWCDTPPGLRAKALREIARLVREHAEEFAMIDAADCGNPYAFMIHDSYSTADQLEFFAGLVTENKGASIPMGPQILNVSVREPLGVVVKIVAFNHPFMFSVAKAAAPLAAGNAVIVKPPEQASLSALRFAEIVHRVLPDGVLNFVTGGREAGAALAGHASVAKVAVVGSVQTGRAVLAAGAPTIKPALLELGGKNALIAFPDADPSEVAEAVIAGMNFAWCGQSCGSTSRAFLHDEIHDEVIAGVMERASRIAPGDPTDPQTRMGAIISRTQYERVLEYIEAGKAEGARLLCGGGPPKSPALADGLFIEPTVFTDVTSDMRIAREEIFGPVLSVLRWRDEKEMIQQVNGTDYGLTCSIWTNDLHRALSTAKAVEVGYVWVNETGKHFLGAPFGGYKQSGIGREECLEELFAYSQEKNIHIRYKPNSMSA